MKLFRKNRKNKETKVFEAKINRNVCIYGPPEMLKKYRQNETVKNEEPHSPEPCFPTDNIPDTVYGPPGTSDSLINDEENTEEL